MQGAPQVLKTFDIAGSQLRIMNEGFEGQLKRVKREPSTLIAASLTANDKIVRNHREQVRLLQVHAAAQLEEAQICIILS